MPARPTTCAKAIAVAQALRVGGVNDERVWVLGWECRNSLRINGTIPLEGARIIIDNFNV
jgi:hypothetical protein